MKILIDARMYGHQHFTGIGRYIEELIAQLEQLDQTNDYVILLGRKNIDSYTPKAANFTKQLAPYPHYSLAEQLFLPGLLSGLRADLVHFPSFNQPLIYGKKHVTTIHDLTTITHAAKARPGLLGSLKQLKRLPARLMMSHAAKSSAAILTPTQYVKDGIIRRYGIADETIVVTSEGFTAPQAAKLKTPQNPPSAPFLFYVGTYYPHKNIDRLLKAFVLLRNDHPELTLVLAGKADYTYEATQKLAKDLGLGDSVSFVGRISDEKLSWYYQNCAAYVFPSLSEGFGLPGLEAMTQGAPIVAAQASCLPEVYADAAHYFDPLDTNDMAAKIAEVLDDTKLQTKLRSAGAERLKDFSWGDMAKQTLEVYERALGALR
jgi:glycosyltransferase involved in cell wall biosynthesis